MHRQDRDNEINDRKTGMICNDRAQVMKSMTGSVYAYYATKGKEIGREEEKAGS